MKKLILVIVVSTIIFSCILITKTKLLITVIYTTDLQGFITPHVYTWPDVKGNPLMGGSASLAAYIKKEKRLAQRQNRVFLLVDTGNFFAGQAEGYFSKGSSMIEIMNMLNYDAMAVGPKDFAFGEENLKNLAKKAAFPFLSANIVKEDTGKSLDYIRPYIIKEYRKVKVGIIGITNPSVFPGNINGLKIINPIAAIQKYIPILKDAGAGLIMVLSNLGLESDIRLAGKVEGIHIVIGGNDKEGYRDPCFVEPHYKTIVPWTWEKGAAVMPLFLAFNSVKNKVIKYDNRWIYLLVKKNRPDSEINPIVQKYIKETDERKKEVIGYAQAELTKAKDKESSLGNWIADVLRKKTKTEICLVGGIQEYLNQGQITVADVYNILPIIDRLEVVGFNLAVLEMTGEQIKQLLEAGVSHGLEQGEGVLQVSGLKYAYDLKRKKWDRITDVTINGKKLDLSKTYKVATNGYLAAGMGGYYNVKDAGRRWDTGLMDFDVLVEYIKEHSPVNAAPLEGRIVRIE